MDDKVYPYGINGETGEYLIPPLTESEMVSLITRSPPDKALADLLESLHDAATQPVHGLPPGMEATDAGEVGWGIVFHEQEVPEVKAALQPLIDHRRNQIGDSLVKVLSYRDKEGHVQWLARHKVAVGAIEPEKVPYYLLVVGSPEKIPFGWGHTLDVEYAVGRLHFDAVADYDTYVASVIRYETCAAADLMTAREAAFFAPRINLDPATRLSADELVKPLAEGYQDGNEQKLPIAVQDGFATRTLWGKDAGRAALKQLFIPPEGGKSPALLFIATHGIGFPAGHANQLERQGGLICKEYPGPGFPFQTQHYFSAADVPAEGNFHGMIPLIFACYGAGTPGKDRFFQSNGKALPIANQPFIAALPKALLAHPKGGALACIGHVERTWPQSIHPPFLEKPLITPFENLIHRILRGEPVGHALQDFNQRYATYSTLLADLLELPSEEIPKSELISQWLWRNDSEGYVVIGDPLVRLRTGDLSSV